MFGFLYPPPPAYVTAEGSKPAEAPTRRSGCGFLGLWPAPPVYVGASEPTTTPVRSGARGPLSGLWPAQPVYETAASVSPSEGLGACTRVGESRVG